MGSRDTEAGRDSDESPQHQVTVPDFFMGRYEVTQAQYEAVMGTNPANFQGANNPVEQVSWEDAQEFCRRLSQLTGRTYRLPTEAEWEYAARAGTTTPFSYGESITPAVVNYDGNYPYGNAPQGEYRRTTIAVNTLYPNAWGLYHIHGNVWEWVQDQYRDSYSNKPSNLVSDGSIPWITNTNVLPENDRRVLRGGSWVFSARDARSAIRVRSWAVVRVNDDGFRVVLVR
jgi:formylglycine-generating enzyme required for sulfatase activity